MFNQFINFFKQSFYFMQNKKAFSIQAIMLFITLQLVLDITITAQINSVLVVFISFFVKLLLTCCIWLALARNGNQNVLSFVPSAFSRLPWIIGSYFIMAFPMSIAISMFLTNQKLGILNALFIIIGIFWYIRWSLLPIIITLEKNLSFRESLGLMKQIGNTHFAYLSLFCLITVAIPLLLSISPIPSIILGIIDAILTVFFTVFTFRFYKKLS